MSRPKKRQELADEVFSRKVRKGGTFQDIGGHMLHESEVEEFGDDDDKDEEVSELDFEPKKPDLSESFDDGNKEDDDDDDDYEDDEDFDSDEGVFDIPESEDT